MQTEYPHRINARRSKNCVSIDRQNCFTKSVKQARKNIWTRRKTPLRASAWAVACYGTLFANMCIICEYLEMIWLVFRSILPILFPVKHTKNTRSAHNSPGNTKLTLRRRFDTPKNRCHSLRPARLIKKRTKTLSTTKLTGEAHATHPNRCNSTRVPLPTHTCVAEEQKPRR